MTYSALAALANDGDFRQRVAACAAEQQVQAGADLGGCIRLRGRTSICGSLRRPLGSPTPGRTV